MVASALLATTLLGAGAVFAPSAAHAQAAQSYDIPAGPLAVALNRFAEVSNVKLFYDSALTNGLSSPGLQGSFNAPDALSRLLAGTGLTFRQTGVGAFTLERAPTAEAGTVQLGAVRVEADQASFYSGERYAGIEETATGPVNGFVAKKSMTGTKTDAEIIEIPQSISVITSDRIEAMGAVRLRDALAYTPGITVPYGQDSRTEWVHIRGFDAFAPGYYLDGLQMRNAGLFSVWQTENYSTERIEVLRGPASVLYGQNVAGGMVNIISKRPTEVPLGELQVQAGSNSRFQVAGDLSGPLNSDGSLLGRITGLVRDARVMFDENLPDDRIFVSPSLTWKPSARTTLTVSGQYIRTRTTPSWQTLPLVGTILPNPNGRIPQSTYLGEPDYDRHNQHQWMLGYQFEHRFSEQLAFRQNLRFGRLKLDYMSVTANPIWLTVNPDDLEDPANFRQVPRSIFGSQEKARLFNLDNQIEAKLATGDLKHTIVFGVDYQGYHLDRQGFQEGVVPPIDVYQPIYGQQFSVSAASTDENVRLKQTGFYAQDQLKFRDRWVLTIGGRYDSARTDWVDRISGIEARKTDHAFTGRAGLVYLHPAGWAPYVSYAESFLPTTTIDPDTGRPFSAETGRQVEAGLRYQPTGRNEMYSIAVFDLRRQNYVTYDTSYTPRQIGEVTVQGVELEAVLNPLEGLNITTSYSWTPKSEVTKSSQPDEIGKALTAVPEHSASIWADYRFDPGIRIGAGVRYVGSNRGYGDRLTVTKFPDYALVDALIGYDVGHWHLALNARNLLNKIHVTSGAAFGVGTDMGAASYGERRSIVATMAYRW